MDARACAVVACLALLTLVPAVAVSAIGGAAGAGFCRDCPATDCGDAARKAEQLGNRLAELRRSEEVISQRADDARAQASRAYSGAVGPNGSAGRFSQEYGGMADARESLAVLARTGR